MLIKPARYLFAATVTVSLAIATSSTAYAGFGEQDPPPSTPTTKGGTVTITVTGTALKGGSPGHEVSRRVSVPSPCWMEPGRTGKDNYEFTTGTGKYAGKGMEWWNSHTGSEMTPDAGYEKYKDDTTGRWWSGTCNSGNYDGPIKDFFELVNTYFKAHPSMFIPAGQPVPVPPVPPEVLRDAAIAEMTLPTPTIDWNPKTTGTNGTIVNLDTWVWLTDRREDLYVEATAETIGTPTSARVNVKLDGMTVSAPGGESANCKGPGVPYTRDATDGCTITFTHASTDAAGTPVTTQSQWTGEWLANGVLQGPIDQPEVPPAVTPIRVSEVGTYNR